MMGSSLVRWRNVLAKTQEIIPHRLILLGIIMNSNGPILTEYGTNFTACSIGVKNPC